MAIREHKTVGEDIGPLSDYWKRLAVDQQISNYFLAALTLGHQVETVEYDVIRKPGIEPRKLTKAERTELDTSGRYFNEQFNIPSPERETPDLYGARLAADLVDRPDYYFARREIPRLAADIEEFRCELWQIAQQLNDARRSGRWSRNTDACLRPYRCEFFEPCMSGSYPLTDVPPGYVRLNVLHPELEATHVRTTESTTTQNHAAAPAGA